MSLDTTPTPLIAKPIDTTPTPQILSVDPELHVTGNVRELARKKHGLTMLPQPIAQGSGASQLQILDAIQIGVEMVE